MSHIFKSNLSADNVVSDVAKEMQQPSEKQVADDGEEEGAVPVSVALRSA
jgi:hypothetical protein